MTTSKQLFSICLICAGALLSCEKINPCRQFAELSVEPLVSDDTPLRLDGYYYPSPEDSNQLLVAGYDFFLLYANGVVYGGFGASFQDIESSLRDNPAEIVNYDLPIDWGVANVQSDSIQIEHWFPQTCGRPSAIYRGSVVDDTTFVIDQMQFKDIHSEVSEPSSLFKTFHFRPFSPKPDSTNDFVP